MKIDNRKRFSVIV